MAEREEHRKKCSNFLNHLLRTQRASPKRSKKRFDDATFLSSSAKYGLFFGRIEYPSSMDQGEVGNYVTHLVCVAERAHTVASLDSTAGVASSTLVELISVYACLCIGVVDAKVLV